MLTREFRTKVSIYGTLIQFDSLKQEEESVREWYVKVKNIASECGFGDSLEAWVLDKVRGQVPSRVSGYKRSFVEEFEEVNKVQKFEKGRPRFEKVKQSQKKTEQEGASNTAAGLSCIPFSVYKKYFHAVELESTGVLIKVYHGPVVSPKGQIEVKIKIGEIEKSSKLLVVKGATKSLLSRDMFTHFGLSLNNKNEIFLNDVKIAADIRLAKQTVGKKTRSSTI
ncbi:hypothetical protein ILUMI_17747 [Ignelater luminosus]|uniref:Uncharacterized protein n=1 Tax=Ignelater luminosus TaxID=2038154 RepID=A0A8K0CMQ2_IGNLU|nr:hypothetical protein ILUMI_17747 [Ignelater luminosus]